jgi:serine/threonine-protein kinase RsbW
LTSRGIQSDRYTPLRKERGCIMILRTTIQLTNDSALVPIIRRMAIHPLREFGVIEDDIDRVSAIISEACSNVVKHAYTDAVDYMVDLEYRAERLTITVTDHGKGFDYAGVKTPVPGQDGGYGLSLIKEYADLLTVTSISDQGTRLVMEVSLVYRNAEYLGKARHLDRDYDTL